LAAVLPKKRVRAPRKQRLPTVLSHAEVRAILAQVRNPIHRTCFQLMNFGAYAMLFLTPLYFQAVRGASALHAAVALLPMSVSYMLTAQLSGRIANKLGPRVPMTAGMGLMGLGLLMLALITLNDSLVLIESGLLAIGWVPSRMLVGISARDLRQS
jgi:predicted MFS family arabinose efflux permease